MQDDQPQVAVPQNMIQSWQEIVNILAEVTQVPAALFSHGICPECLKKHY